MFFTLQLRRWQHDAYLIITAQRNCGLRYLLLKRINKGKNIIQGNCYNYVMWGHYFDPGSHCCKIVPQQSPQLPVVATIYSNSCLGCNCRTSVPKIASVLTVMFWWILTVTLVLVATSVPTMICSYFCVTVPTITLFPLMQQCVPTMSLCHVGCLVHREATEEHE